MTSTHYEHFHTPGWHESAHTPVVDGKYIDPQTGHVRSASGAEYIGPPAIDIIVSSIEEQTNDCRYRAQRAFPMEGVLWQIMKIVYKQKISIDSLTAAPYAIRLVLAQKMTPEEFFQIADRVANRLGEEDGEEDERGS